ncbi:unnamed protein product [Lactuca virosa]|uniref:Uncharacterized protein n=1 Tax=Lactuca virosa TaxID=75947 RepID=A0AAU9PJJ7_9ASTR|nr:unnamed protein product [Lactuca virosa]
MGKDNLDMEEGDATQNQEQDWPTLTSSVTLELGPTIDETFMTFNAKKKIPKNLETIDIYHTNMDDGVTHKNMIQLEIGDNNNDNETMEKVS